MSIDETIRMTMPARPVATPIMLRAALKYAASVGADRDEILASVGLLRTSIALDDALIESGRVTDAMEVAARLTHMPDFGLRVGQQVEARRFGAIGLMAEHAPTAADAMRDIGRYIHLLNEATSISVERRSDVHVVRIVSASFGEHLPLQHKEGLASAMITICRKLLGADWNPAKVDFSHTPIAPVSSYQQLLGCRVWFRATETAFLAHISDFERPLPQANAHVRNLSQDMLQELDRARAGDLAMKSEGMLRSMIPSGYTSVGDLANALGLTERTLQRRLGEQGSSFKQVLLRARRDIVRRNAENGLASAADLCAPLGFSEASAVSRFLREHCPDFLQATPPPRRK